MENMGGFAPTLGIMGTVLGLVNVLSNLTDTSSLGHKIAGAFIATFYGVFSANVCDPADIITGPGAGGGPNVRVFDGRSGALLLIMPRPAAEELDPPSDHLDRAAPFAFLLPRTGLQPSVDGHPPALAEVLGAQLSLSVPRRHGHEVGAAVAARAIDGEHEARHPLVGRDLAHLDLGRQVPDQGHHVHAVHARRESVTAESRLCAGLRLE